MPVKMTSYTRSLASTETEMLVKMNITEMSQGQVLESDMYLRFPEGTSVVDAIKGVKYKTDARGNPIESTIEELYDFDPSQTTCLLPKKLTHPGCRSHSKPRLRL